MPRNFKDMTLERDNAVTKARSVLWARKNKDLRTLNVVIASGGLGKSAFLEKLASDLTTDLTEGNDNIVPVLISFNTRNFGREVFASNPPVAIGARMLLSYFIKDPSPVKLELVMKWLGEICESNIVSSLKFISICTDCILRDYHGNTPDQPLPRLMLGVDKLSLVSNSEELLR